MVFSSLALNGRDFAYLLGMVDKSPIEQETCMMAMRHFISEYCDAGGSYFSQVGQVGNQVSTFDDANAVLCVKSRNSNNSENVVSIKNLNYPKFLSLLQHNDIQIRQSAMHLFQSCLYLKSFQNFLKSNSTPANQVLISMLNISKFNKDLIVEVQMGPFKNKVDTGLPTRKIAFESIFVMVDKLQILPEGQNYDVFCQFLECIFSGMNEEDEKMKSVYYLLKTHCLNSVVGLFKNSLLKGPLDPKIQVMRERGLLKMLYQSLKSNLENRIKDMKIEEQEEENKKLKEANSASTKNQGRKSNSNSNDQNSQNKDKKPVKKTQDYSIQQAAELWKLCCQVLYYLDVGNLVDCRSIGRQYSGHRSEGVRRLFGETINGFVGK